MPDQSTPPAVFVDDSDTGILYHGNWTHISGLPTDLNTLSYPNDQRTAWYGTMSVSTPSSTSLSYFFNGTDFRALFINTNASSITSCTIDGHPQDIEDDIGGCRCGNIDALSSSAAHNLTITFHSGEVRFDGLIYTPTHVSLPHSNADILYQGEVPGGIPGKLWVNNTGNNGQVAYPGDTLHVEFNGVSLSIYSRVYFSSPEGTPFQYTIDNEAPINFTITPPSSSDPSDPVTHLEHQLILQTPPNALKDGLHQLQMSIGPEFGSLSQSQLAMVSIERIIVQNSTHSLGLNLSAVPSTSSQSVTGTTSQQSSSPFPSSTGPNTNNSISQSPSRMSHASIAAVVLSISLLLLLIIIWFIRRYRQTFTNSAQRSDGDLVVSPFALARTANWSVPHHVLLFRHEKGLSNQSIPARNMNPHRIADHQGSISTRRVIRYVVHQDGGELAEAHNVAGQGGGVDVSAPPPIYTSVVE